MKFLINSFKHHPSSLIKYNMRIITTIVVMAALILLLYLTLDRTVKENPQAVVFPPTTTPAPIHPYSIDSLKSRQYQSTPKIDQTLSSTSKYTSQIIRYQSDGLELFALYHLPQGQAPPGGWPLIIVNHGYIPPDQFSTINSYKNTAAFYASNGFAVLKPDYRGHDNSQGQPDMAIGRLQYAVDVLNLLAASQSISEINHNQTFLYGHSMGGEVSLIVAQVSPQIKAVSLWASAVTTYPQNVTYFLDKRLIVPTNYPELKLTIQSIIDQYGTKPFTSFENLDQINIPVLLHHGTADESVPYQWGVDLNQKLLDLQKDVVFYSYPNANHDIAQNWSTALSRDLDFFRSHL